MKGSLDTTQTWTKACRTEFFLFLLNQEIRVQICFICFPLVLIYIYMQDTYLLNKILSSFLACVKIEMF